MVRCLHARALLGPLTVLTLPELGENGSYRALALPQNSVLPIQTSHGPLSPHTLSCSPSKVSVLPRPRFLVPGFSRVAFAPEVLLSELRAKMGAYICP